jgi:hypothetical protein
MAFKLIWFPSARFDLKDIATFIAEDTGRGGGPGLVGDRSCDLSGGLADGLRGGGGLWVFRHSARTGLGGFEGLRQGFFARG